ncbi:hypothetical protein JW916_11040 [Candidatus Sumerlaeota bacterium]|nr:hypothetical protein [Candidatus Sumerlaeota bacterium]
MVKKRTILLLGVCLVGVAIGVGIGLAGRARDEAARTVVFGVFDGATGEGVTTTTVSGDALGALSSRDWKMDRSLLSRVPPYRPEDRSLVSDLLDLQEREGRENALLYYVIAGWFWRPQVSGALNQKLDRVLARSWDPRDRALDRYLLALRPVFAEIRKGAALDYARGIGASKGPNTPLPNYILFRSAVKALCLEGRRLESAERYSDALDEYLTALTMGRDLGTPDNLLVLRLASVTMQRIPLEMIRRLAIGGRLDRSTLERVGSRLAEIEATQEWSTTATLALEAKSVEVTFKMMAAEVEAEARQGGSSLFGGGNSPSLGQAHKWIEGMKPAEDSFKALFVHETKYLGAPWWTIDFEAYRAGIGEIEKTRHSGAGPMAELAADIATPDFMVAFAGIERFRSRLHQTRLAVALEMFRSDHGRYPDSLDVLAPTYFAGGLPRDSFSGRDFNYRPTPDGAGYDLWSTGPDCRDDEARIAYDASNGTTSAGDLIFPARGE